MRYRSAMWVVALAGGLSAMQGIAQQTTPANGQEVPGLKRRDDVMTLSASARLVLLDVVVTDAKGKAVKGLKQSDFTLLEDGKSQTLASFVEHSRVSPEEAAVEDAHLKLPPNTYGNYGPARDEGSIVFLLDALDTEVQAQMYLRQQMIAYMKTVPQGTRIAIVALDTQLHLVQGFSSDPEVLLAAVNSKRDSPRFSPMLGGPAASGELRQRMRMEILTQGMQSLAKYLSGFPGRKSLIWFTGNIPVSLVGGGIGAPFADETTNFIDEMTKTTDVLTLNRISIYPVDSRGLQTDPAYSAANGGRPPMNAGFGIRQAVQHGDLEQVAEATGGRAFYNTNGLKEAMAEVADTASNYYTLSFSPANRQFDGRYRKLEVRLAQQGLHLEYRRGYYAKNDDMELAQHVAQRQALKQSQRGAMTVPAVGEAPTAIGMAMGLGAPEVRDVKFLVQMRPAAETGKASESALVDAKNFLSAKYRKGTFRQYAIAYDINAATLRLMPDVDGSYHGWVDVVAVVYDDQGSKVNSSIMRASVDPNAAEYRTMMQKGVGVIQTIAIPAKGNFFLRVGVHDVSADKVGALEVPVSEIKLGVPGLGSVPTKH